MNYPTNQILTLKSLIQANRNMILKTGITNILN